MSVAIAANQATRLPDQTRPQIVFSNVTLDLGGKAILENISLDVRPGEFLCIIGASGCGKTTALRLAAGLYQPTAGSVTFDGKPMSAPRRDIGKHDLRSRLIRKPCRLVCCNGHAHDLSFLSSG